MSNITVSHVEDYGYVFGCKYMRLSHNSQDKSDSKKEGYDAIFENIGPKDMELALKLIKAGPSHSKFLRFIHIHALVKAPLKWWKHFDTYKYAEKLSSSTMHNLMDRELTADDFSRDTDKRCIEIINEHIRNKEFAKATDSLPDGFLQVRAIDTNFACLRNMYHQRKSHRLQEWRDFLDQILKRVAYPVFITN